MKKQNSEGVLADQRSSLEQWVDYFASPDSDYIPNELKYWIFRNIIGLAEFDKEKKNSQNDQKVRLNSFPILIMKHWRMCIDAVDKKLKDQK